MARLRVKYVGKEKPYRTPVGNWVPDQEETIEEADFAFLEQHLPGQFVRVAEEVSTMNPVAPAAKAPAVTLPHTKPATPLKK